MKKLLIAILSILFLAAFIPARWSTTSASTTITGLSSGNLYTFQLTATDDSSQSASASVSVSVNSAILDTSDYKIVIDTAAKFFKGDTVFYQVNDINAGGLINVLFNDQTPDPQNGTNTPIPTNDFTSGLSNSLYYPSVAVIDLGGMYKITSKWIFDYYGTDSINFAYGTPLHWTDTVKYYENAGNTWERFGDTTYTRYIKVWYSNVGNQHVRQLILYGHLVSDSLSRTPPNDSVYHKATTTIGQFIGFNGILPYPIDSVGSTWRHYENQSWIDTVTTIHNVDSIKFVFDRFGNPLASPLTQPWFFPDLPNNITPPLNLTYPTNAQGDSIQAHGGVIFDALQGVPQYFINLNLGKPIDPILFPDRDSTNPLEYTRTARMFWNYAAVFGKKIYPSDSIQTPYPTISGLGLRNYVETGNEMDQDWSGKQNFYSPQVQVAYNSAIYDGDCGLMGSRMGVKAADSSMKVIWAGVSSSSPVWLKGFKYFSYYSRPNHSMPTDVLNVHHYNTDGINGASTSGHAFSPEMAGTRQYMANYVQLAHEVCPRCEVWLTEWGYDRNRKLSLSVPVINGLDSAQIQAQWIAREWLELSFSGLDRATIFQMHNDALSTQLDSIAYLNYNTTGLIDGHYLGNQYQGIYAFSGYAFPAWYYQRTIWLRLYNYKADSIIYENNDSIWVYRYRNLNNPDSVAYAVWSGTQTNRFLNNYVLRTGHASTPIEQVTLADKYMNGVDTTKITDVNGNFAITITESPKLYFTTLNNIGGTLADSASSQVNIAPTLNVSNQSTTKDTTTITATAIPGNSPIISYKWTQIGGTPIQFSLPSQNQQGAQIGNLTANSTYTFSITAMDSNGLTATKQVILSTNNQPATTGGKVLLYIYQGKLILVQ